MNSIPSAFLPFQIELEEILNEHSKDNLEENADYESDDDANDVRQSKIALPNRPTAVQSSKQHRTSLSTEMVLPHPKKKKPSVERSSSHDVVCYSCGKYERSNYSICLVHCRPSYEQMRAGVPYYPSILKQAVAKGGELMCDSLTFMCMTCLPKFPPMWHPIQEDFLKQLDNKHQSALPRIPLPDLVLCFSCGCEVSTKNNRGLIASDFLDKDSLDNAERAKAKTLKDVLEDKKTFLRPVPLSFGFTYFCSTCLNVVKTKPKRTESVEVKVA